MSLAKFYFRRTFRLFPPLYALIGAVALLLVAGQTVLTGFSPQELTFICGKHLAMYRGEHYIKTLFPTVTELTVLLFAGIKLVAPEAPVPQDIEKQITLTGQQLRQFMQPMQLEGLRMVVKKFLAEGAKANIKRWVQCVDITAARSGLPCLPAASSWWTRTTTTAS